MQNYWGNNHRALQNTSAVIHEEIKREDIVPGECLVEVKKQSTFFQILLCCHFCSSRNSSTKDLTQFAAEAIAFNRQLSQHDEQQEDVGAIVCSMRLSPPSNSRLARRRAQSNALRTRDFAPASDDLAAWRNQYKPPRHILWLILASACSLCVCVYVFTGSVVEYTHHQKWLTVPGVKALSHGQ